jgi:ABC-type phosphate/phosphonate transport system substrate-binding protein
MICNARMYALTPGITDAWRTLLLRVGARAGLSWTYAPHAAPAPMRSLWDRSDNACVFMCGLPYVHEAARPLLLAAPVPAPARYAGRPIYFSEFIARADGPITSLEVPAGTRLAHMLPEGNSGYNTPRHHLLQRVGAGRPSPFLRTREPTPTPMSVLQAVTEGRAEVGVVDSYVLDLLRQHAPDTMAPLRSIATTQASPIPLLVASPGSSQEEAGRARAALLSAHEDAASRAAMERLLLARFVAVDAADYAVLAEREAEADRAGFAITQETA